MLASGQNGGLIGYTYSPALGPVVNSSVYSLAVSTRTAQRNWQRLKQNQGYEIVACMQSIECAWSINTRGDIDRFQNTTQNVKAPLQRSQGDVIGLISETHQVVENARSQITTLMKQIDQMNTEINDLESAAQSLDAAATSDAQSAGQWKLGGFLLAVLGGVMAPATLGLTWLVSGVGVAAFYNGEQIEKKARELRAVAQRKRDSIAEMEARKNYSVCERSRLQGELQNKKQELEKVKGYQQTAESVWSNLNWFGKLLNAAFTALLEFEVALQNVSQSADSIRILQGLLTQKSYVYLSPTARRTFDNFRFQMRSIRDFLSQEGIPISSSPLNINNYMYNNQHTQSVQHQPNYTNGVSVQQYTTQEYIPYPTPNSGLHLQPYSPPVMYTQTQFSTQSTYIYPSL